MVQNGGSPSARMTSSCRRQRPAHKDRRPCFGQRHRRGKLALTRGRSTRMFGADAQPDRCPRAPTPSATPSTVAWSPDAARQAEKFMAGAPDEAGDEIRWQAVCKKLIGAPTCSIRPAFSTTICRPWSSPRPDHGSQDHRRLQVAVGRLKLSPTCTQFGVQVRQRFVEQKDLRFLDDGPAITRWRWPPESWPALRVPNRVQLQDPRGVGDRRLRSSAGKLFTFIPVHVPAHRVSMRVKRIGLEHHRHCQRSEGAARVTSPSPMWMVPSEMLLQPAIERSSVDLPQPEGRTKNR